MKEFLQQGPVLRYPDPQANYTLYTDASKYAYAGILSQHSNGTDHPISFYIDTAKITVKNDHLLLKKFLEKNTLNAKVNN